MAEKLYSTRQLASADASTVQFKTSTGGVTFVPIPANVTGNLAGLFTIDLPEGVEAGQEFNVVVRRLSSRQPPPVIQIVKAAPAVAIKSESNWRYVVGSFAVTIPVATPRSILPSEENTLAILKWRLTQTSPGSRWFPVLGRYTSVVAGRVDGLGGNSGAIPPSPTGAPPAPAKTRVKVEITFPPNLQEFNAGDPIEVRGNATWQPPGASPVGSMQLSAFESRWDGISFGPWVHVNDFPLALEAVGSDRVAWKHAVVPFDRMARYRLKAFAFDSDNKLVGSSDPLVIKSV